MMMKIFGRGDKAKAFRSSEDGSALVELALSLPLLSLMLLGAVEFARVAYASIEVTNAAHSGALYAASGIGEATDSTGVTNAASADSPNLFGGNAVTATLLSPTCTCANTKYTPSSCSDNVTCQSNNSAMVTTITVQTTTTYSPIIHIPGGSSSYTLHGQSSQVVSNQ